MERAGRYYMKCQFANRVVLKPHLLAATDASVDLNRTAMSRKATLQSDPFPLSGENSFSEKPAISFARSRKSFFFHDQQRYSQTLQLNKASWSYPSVNKSEKLPCSVILFHPFRFEVGHSSQHSFRNFQLFCIQSKRDACGKSI